MTNDKNTIDPRATAAAEKAYPLEKNFGPGDIKIYEALRNALIIGWQARDAAGPATREQGSAEKQDDVTAYLEMTDELDRARKNILYWMKKAEKAELIAEMLTSPESTKYVLRQYSTLDSEGRKKIDTLMEALFAIKESAK